MIGRDLGGMRRCLACVLACAFGLMGAVAAQAGQSGGQVDLAAPALALSPDKVVLDALAGESVTLTRDINVTDASGSADAAFSVTIQSGNDWLMVGTAVDGTTVAWGSSVSGKLPGVLRVFAKVSGLTPGIHTGAIAVALSGSAGNPALLPVIINVRSRPSIILRPNALNFSHQAGNRFSQVDPQTLSVFGGVTDFSILSSGESWFYVNPAASTTPTEITVNVDPTGLEPGTYLGTILIVAPGSPNSGLSATVTLTVTEPSAYSAAPAAVSLQALYGSKQPVSASVLLDTNGEMLPVKALALNASWLSMTALDSWVGVQDGSTGIVAHVPARTRVVADPTGLPVGTYSSNIIVGDDTRQITIPVTLKVIPNDLIIPHVADGGGWHTVITLVNTDNADAPFTIKFRQADGSPLILPVYSVGFVSEFADKVPANGTLAIETANWDPTVSQGWAELIPERSIGASASVHLLGASSENAAAVAVEPPVGKRFLLHFDNTDSIQTDLLVVNSGNSPSTISMVMRDENGNPIISDSITLPPYGRRDLQLRDIYPQLINQRGVAEFKSSSDTTTALGLRTNLQGGFTSFQPVVVLPSSADTVTRTLAQVVDGYGWKTALMLINPGSKPVPFSVVFRDDGGGTAYSLPLHSIADTLEYSDVVPAGGLRVIESAGTSAPLAQRWAEIVSIGQLGGTAIFVQTMPDGSESDASLAIGPPPGDHFILPFNNTGGSVMALALLNESKNDKLSTVVLRDETGRWLSTQYLLLNPGTGEVFFLSNRFPGSDGIRGSIEFLNAQFTLLGLNFNPQGSFSAVSPIGK